MLEPAKTVIEVCGGVSETARLSGRSEIRVRRWAYTKEKGGTGGLVPSDAAATLLKNAKGEGLALEPDHFFVGAEGAT